MANVLNGPIGGISKPEEIKSVELALADGNQSVYPTDGKVLKEVIINKPATLINTNIKEGVIIAGVLGTFQGGGIQPNLNAPTISRSGNTLTLTNPSTNGNFTKGYKLYDGSTLLATISATGSTTYNLLNLGIGVYNLTATTYGTNFQDSIPSNSIIYAIYTITNNLTNITTNNSATSIGIGQNYAATLSAISGKYLPNFITLTIGGLVGDYSYNNETGAVAVNNVSGDIVITAVASDYPRLTKPTIVIEDAIVTWESIIGANKYGVLANGIEIAETTLLTTDLSELLTVDGIYAVTIIAKGINYQDSNPSNSVIYNVGVMVYGVTGLDLSTPTLTRTDNNVGKTYYINSSTGIITTDFDSVFPEQYVGDQLQEITFSTANNYWVNNNNEQYTGNVFRRINKFYKQVEIDDSNKRLGFKIAIANSCPAGYYCPAYFLNESGQEMDFHLIGVYKNYHVNSKLQSLSGKIPNYTTAINYQTFGKNASNEHINAFAKDWRSDQLICDLFMLIFAERNTQTVWASWRSYQQITGVTNSLRGTAQCGFDTSTKAPLFLGVEDIIGNGFEYISGIYFNNSSIYYSTTPSTDAASLSGKKLLGYTRYTSTGYFSRLGYNQEIPDLEYPIASGGSSTTYYCDYVYYQSGERVLYKGAHGVHAYYGLFCAYGIYSASVSHYFFSARLCAQPL